MPYPCACCGSPVLSGPDGTYDICPVCFWQDDPVQNADPDYAGGANRISLQEARENFKKFGAMSEEFLKHVRRPKIKRITFPTPLSMIENPEDDNVDVFVELDDGHVYTLVVTTPKNLYGQMDDAGLDYIPASPPQIIVHRLEEPLIRAAVETFLADNAYWLKWYFLCGERIEEMNPHLDRLMDEIRKENEEIFGEED